MSARKALAALINITPIDDIVWEYYIKDKDTEFPYLFIKYKETKFFAVYRYIESIEEFKLFKMIAVDESIYNNFPTSVLF